MASRDEELYETYSRDFDPETLDDLVLLNNPTDTNIAQKLKNRYNQQSIYTYIGPTVVSVNPYEKLPDYTNEVKVFYNSRQPYELAPHLYSLAEDAFRSMKESGTSQSIVISGESGAGKTEAAKYILDYIAQVGVSGLISENIKRIMIESTPVLEAFGNAKTLKNDNSSRFGKYIDLFFNFKGQMEGGHITTSLLEKGRVVEQRKGERNFHIFYQLCASADDTLKERLHLQQGAKAFAYLNKNELTVKNINDKQDFKRTSNSMTESGISMTEQMEIFRVVAGILHLGNIKFKYTNPDNVNEGTDVENPEALKCAASCFDMDEQNLKESIVYRKIKVGSEITKTLQTPEKAEANRDTLAKGIYERIFKWLIRRVNASVKRPDDAKTSIGILDIYGFEIYNNNSLEQFNINYVNEKIQQQIQRWLQAEQDEYIEEGVPNWQATKLFNCDPCCKIIEDKPYGIYAYLDEETLIPNGNDSNYIGKMNAHFEGNNVYEMSRFKGLTFGLKHFVAVVTYNVEKWVEKNRDTMYDDLIQSMRTSSSEFIKQLFPSNERVKDKGKLQKTTAQNFKEDVTGLVAKLKGKRHHFVKCIKPNHDKKPKEFVDNLVMDQIRYLGLSENVHVRSGGYYFKMPYDKFLSRYKLCSERTFPKFNGTAREGCEAIIKDTKLQGKYAFGKTKIFLQTPVQLFELDEMIQNRRAEMASIVQRAYRKYKIMKTRMEKEHLARALEETYGEKATPSMKQIFNTIDLRGERKKQLLVMCPTAFYIVDPKSYCVLRRVPLSRLGKISYSNLADGVICVSCDKQYDMIMEFDNKSDAVKGIKEAYEALHKNKTLPITLKEEFQFTPRRGVTKWVKYVRNYGAKTTIIEAVPEGLQISIKPSEDIYNGEKKRRKASFTRKYYGDYIRLQQSELMKTLEKDHGDKHVIFSGVVGKYNKAYKRQERILMITERAMYNIDPNGYAVNRRIKLQRIKGAYVSPLTDNFFILHVPDEYDYVFESSKKTEILKALAEHYTAATRGTFKVQVKPSITYRSNKKDANITKTITFEEDFDAKETYLQAVSTGAEVHVLPEDIMSKSMKSTVIQDIYSGQKWRRKESLLKHHLGDYLHLQGHPVMEKIAKKYGENKLLYSGVVTKINNRYKVQDRKLLITEQAIYNLEKDGYGINRRIPLKSVKGIMVSTLKDGFFVLRVPDEYDYLFSSPNKTEIIKTIIDQQKVLAKSDYECKPADLIVDDHILYSPFHPSKMKGIRTIEFKDVTDVKMPTIYPTKTGILVKVNNQEDEIGLESMDDSEEAQKKFGHLDKDPNSIYHGRKRRNKKSLYAEELGDYLRLKESTKVKQMLRQFGDKELLFSSEVNKINKKFKKQNRIMLISDKAVYNIDPTTFKLKRRINLDEIDGVSLSSLTDGHFCLHMPNQYDYLMESDKKSEILNVLSRNKRKTGKELAVNVADKFEFCPTGGEVTTCSFVLDENVDDSFIESTNSGLMVHVTHDEPKVVLEAAYIHVKDQEKPIEVKNNPVLIRLRKRWKYKLEIRFYVNEHLQGCSFVEKIDTVSQRQEYKSQIGDLEPREERYVIMLPERLVIHSILSKTRVKAKLIDPLGNVLLAVRFIYDVK